MNSYPILDFEEGKHFVRCAGIEIEPGKYSGCDSSRGNACPVCDGMGRVIYCPRCGEEKIIIINGSMRCPSPLCDLDIYL